MHSFNCATLTCNAIGNGDAWRSIFGVYKTKEENSASLSILDDVCDPMLCRMTSGVCVDCSRCSNHCTCDSTKTRTQPSSECDPTRCRQLICGDCSKCTKHCICNYEYPKTSAPLPTRKLILDDAYFQCERKREVYYTQR